MKLKIGFVLDDSLDKADGVQQYVLTIGEWLRGQGHDVHYLVGKTNRMDIANIHSLSKNVSVRFNGNRMSMPLPASKKAIKSLLVAEKFDVLHIQLPYSPWLAQRIIAAAGPNTVIFGTFHIVPQTPLVRIASKALAVWTRPTLKKFDQIVSVSTAAQEFAAKTFNLQTSILPNVVEVARFRNLHSKNMSPDKPATIIFLGRLVPRKGCQVLLGAVNLLKQQPDLPDFQVIVCGRGPLEAKLKTYVLAHDLSSSISFTGFIEETDKPQYLQSADIAVFPSTGGESFGIVLIEAMAAGAMVLAGDNVGYRTVMEPHLELLFPTKNSIILAQKLAHYLRNRRACESVVKWQDAYVKSFDVDVVGQRLVKSYTEVLLQRKNVR